jgi:hypothetical protein
VRVGLHLQHSALYSLDRTELVAAGYHYGD